MRTTGKIVLLAMLILSLTASTSAQETLWKELNRKVKMLYQQGQYSEAAKVAEEALRVAEETFGPNHPDVATVCENLAKCYKELGKEGEAEKLETRARKIRSVQ